MNSVQQKSNVRSTTMFGLSIIKIIFDDNVEDFLPGNRSTINCGISRSLKVWTRTCSHPTALPARFSGLHLKSKDRDSREFDITQLGDRQATRERIPGVADVVAFGGRDKIYEVQVNPTKLVKYNITPLEVYQAVTKSNVNVGGDVIEKNGQAYVVRGIGLLNSIP
jgi:cobalt-zinc-cadmium resistance protein CzcA